MEKLSGALQGGVGLSAEITPSGTLTAALTPSAGLVGALAAAVALSASLSSAAALSAALSIPAVETEVETYSGPYEFTPTQETQTVSISGKKASGNITVNPIPSNYGLITWDGSVLTVS